MHSIYNYTASQAYILEKETKKRTFWKKKRKKKEPILSLQEKSDKPNPRRKKSFAASFHRRSVTPNSAEKEIKKKRMSLAL